MNVSEFTLIFAFRYALGRMSTAPSYVVDDIKNNWNQLSNAHKKLIKEEIEEAIENGNAGMQCDSEIWKQILVLEG